MGLISTPNAVILYGVYAAELAKKKLVWGAKCVPTVGLCKIKIMAFFDSHSIYIYIYIPLRKTKTGHIRIINLFPSCYGY